MAQAIIRWFDASHNEWGWRYYCTNCGKWHAPEGWPEKDKAHGDFPRFCKGCSTTLNKRKWMEVKASPRRYGAHSVDELLDRPVEKKTLPSVVRQR